MQTLFDCYAVTGGLPKYLEILVEDNALSRARMLDFILKPHSPFINEGKNLPVEEFGRDYGTYFSILELIATGKTELKVKAVRLLAEYPGYTVEFRGLGLDDAPEFIV